MMELTVDFCFAPEDSARLQRALTAIGANPYTRYGEFDARVDAVIRHGQVPQAFLDACASLRHADTYESPYVVLRNCPIDADLPYLDFDDPVTDKRTRKKTYVAEAFLLLYAKLMGQEPIGYANVNDGDIFQDIHPKKNLAESQSQKAMKPIYFHKDLANHFVRPDWVNILGLRASPENDIYTSYVRNKDLLAELGEAICADLRREEFHTPYDDLTMHNSKVRLGEADVHPVLGGATPTDLRFFENRTRGLTPRASRAIDAVVIALHKLKQRVRILPGDLVGAANNDCLHNKDVGLVRDADALRNRWLMKTVNVRSLAQHAQYFAEDRPRIVNG
ncbi:hypothetical protein [Bordetella bronchialis]|uniref:TauD/TfdA-like domain-containing protein n=1 Tax=Bordetella bronchialis TaxID=463025 RepID=A0A193FNB0_9BORD|nr:hypothetical protein [Bordetella bronchialis]ANN68661.1 hypothetical protein BAU06_22245 [Bordetella bronchialis]ANN73801.1 hypothetical protein BAU08_22775 [Bordetella bronchialis]